MAATSKAEIEKMDHEANMRAAGRCLVDSARRGNMDMVTQLFKENPTLDVNSRDGLGNAALHYAGMEGHGDVLKFVLAKGADPNLQNYAGDTPLHKTTWANEFECVKILCDAGANPNVKNKKKIGSTSTCRTGQIKEYVIQVAMAFAAKQEKEARQKREADLRRTQDAANAAGQKSEGATFRDEDFQDKEMLVEEGDDGDD
jgi:ankyrin repeat protein